jgi:NDP-4-keto-2,6-dideoxyhexose 3-C-methyltransferase
MTTKINQCRICKNTHLLPILDLGNQMLTGVFPREKNTQLVTTGPLRLVKCDGVGACGLVQLEHSYDLAEMYGLNYGYRSGLNKSMVDHLHGKIAKILQAIELKAGDLVIDIGSNDSTSLQAYPKDLATLVGIDPTGVKFHHYYPEHIQLIPDFFSARLVQEQFPGRKAKVVTSFSMFYDLEDPLSFMREVADVLADDGIWVFEQSYMPTMLQTNSFDTVCHEHLEFYALKQIQFMVERTGLHIVDVELNETNGGSFSITVRKSRDDDQIEPSVQAMLAQEVDMGLEGLEPFEQFSNRIELAKNELLSFLKDCKVQGKKVAALGASTKGNVLLQYCNLTQDDIFCVGEVNSEKFNCYTPGTWIPIIPESELISVKPDYLVVLPWHFRSYFIHNAKFKGIQMVFPLPKLEIVQ